MTDKPYYLTTAIFYPNAKPHIGHAYEALLTDCLARYQRWRGRTVRLVSGTDEHGLKMAQTAKREGLTPQQLADRNAPFFQSMLERYGCDVQDFVRTTEDRHRAASEAIWNAMAARGDIYLDKYEGWYSVREEAFFDASELTEGANGEKLTPNGTPVEWTVEETYFFRLSAYQDKLLAYYDEHPEFIQPQSRRNEVLSFVRGGLRDLSISRQSFDWGFAVPGAPDHVMYVWVDALTTYLTGAGYPDANPFWPADVHMIGKDILRFHAVYWPAFLMSANIVPPRRLAVHGFLFNRGEKMSKSLGNVIDPIDLVDRYGVDAVRYFFLREVPFGQDGNYSHEAIVTRVNAELGNSFGNLVQRVLSFVVKNLNGRMPMPQSLSDVDEKLLTDVRTACSGDFVAAFEGYHFSTGIEAWLRAVFACNQYVDHQAPWALRQSDPARMETVLAVLVRAIRDLAITIQPVIPTSAQAVLTLLGIRSANFAELQSLDWLDPTHTIPPPTPLFPRLEAYVE
jgi:methionyl-tRNA synthetase